MSSRMFFVLLLIASSLVTAGCGRRVQKPPKQAEKDTAEKPRSAVTQPPVIPGAGKPAPESGVEPATTGAYIVEELEAEKTAHVRTKSDLLVMTKKYAEAEREIQRLKESPGLKTEADKAPSGSAADASEQRLLALAREFYDNSNYESAKKVLEILIGLGHKGGYAYFMLARCYTEFGYPDKAISYYKMTCDFYEPVEPKPNYYFYALNNLGTLLRQQKRYGEAKIVYERAELVNPDYATVQYNLGVLYAEYLNDKRRAVEHYQKYLDLKGERSADVRERIRVILEELKKEENR